MQAVVNESATSATPWKQFLWTSGTLDDAAGLEAAGVEIRSIDEHWRALHLERKAARWTAEGDIRWLARLVGLIAVGAYGGVYMDADIGPGTLSLKKHPALPHGSERRDRPSRAAVPRPARLRGRRRRRDARRLAA